MIIAQGNDALLNTSRTITKLYLQTGEEFTHEQ